MQPNRDAWLDRMPDLLAMAAARWGLRIAGPLQGGSLSCVHACTDADGAELVLKLLPPHTPSEREAEALHLWNGRGAARLIGHDPDRAERWAFVFAAGEACETWRQDSDELQEWVRSHAARVIPGG